MIGSRLRKLLKQKDHTVSVLSRSPKKLDGALVYHWNYEKEEIEEGAVESADFIVHLAGENLMNKSWTGDEKKLIADSRVKTAELIFHKVKSTNKKLKAFISASAVGYYGAITSEKIITENDPPGNDFLAVTCCKWESAADKFSGEKIRTVKIRTSPVLSSKGGILDQLKIPVQSGLAAPLGNGRQYFPWIHIDDLCAIYLKAIEDESMQGAYNAAAPQHVTNEEFMRALAKAMGKPFWLPPVPEFMVKLLFGEKGTVALKGSRISPEKIISAGYRFLFPGLKEALENILGNKEHQDNV
jgi:uncharacterized protein